jgi:hypothetical protein
LGPAINRINQQVSQKAAVVAILTPELAVGSRQDILLTASLTLQTDFNPNVYSHFCDAAPNAVLASVPVVALSGFIRYFPRTGFNHRLPTD